MRVIVFFAAACVAAAVSACSTDGGFSGAMTDRAGRPLGIAQAHFIWTGASGDLTIDTPEGERFVGRAVSARQHVDHDPRIVVRPGDTQDRPTYEFGGDETVSTGVLTAELVGDRGHSMSCRVTEARPGWGFEGGGAGVCTRSDGARMSVSF